MAKKRLTTKNPFLCKANVYLPNIYYAKLICTSKIERVSIMMNGRFFEQGNNM